MKPQPEPTGKGPRPIPPIHPDTIAYEKHLRAFAFGQKFSYEDAAKLVRRDLKTSEDAIKAHLQSAERRLQNAEGMVFGPYHDQQTGERGRMRLDDTGIMDRAIHRTGQVSRTAKRIQRLAACADPTALTPEYQRQQAAVMLAARGAQRFTETKGREKFLRLVSNSTERIPELEMAWKALNGA